MAGILKRPLTLGKGATVARGADDAGPLESTTSVTAYA